MDGSDAQDEPMDPTPPLLAIIFRSTRPRTMPWEAPPSTRGPTMTLEMSPWTGHHPRWPSPSGGPRPRMCPWAVPLPDFCATQAPITWAVFVWSPLDPYDAMEGTDDGLSPSCKSASDPMFYATALGKGTYNCPRPQTRHRAEQAPAQRLTLTLKISRWDTTAPSIAVIFRSPQPHTRLWAARPLASCAPYTTTTRAVIVWSPMAPYDAVRGTDDGLGPT
ncbi:Mitotic Checkpoint Serine/Threonine-Protein Kinase Bub1 Beta, partial [Manis pentadactyla]